MNVNEHHVHHLAKRLHEAHSKLDALTGKLKGGLKKAAGTLEVSTGAFIGGTIEGKSEGAALFGVVPYNLVVAAGALAIGHTAHMWGGQAGAEWSEDINNLANGVLAGYVASKGYAFGKAWHDNGFRGAFGSHGGGPSLPPPVVQGEVDAAQLQAMVDRLQPQPAR